MKPAAALLLCALSLVRPLSAAAQERAQPSLTVDVASGYRPVLTFGALLRDPELADAVHSGLPVRVRVRLELWRDRLIDEITGSQSWNSILLYDPLDRRYIVRGLGSSPSHRFISELAVALVALERAPPIVLRPGRPGRYYYTANIEVETLSLSDLEELERWLQGAMQPAVAGERSIAQAVGEGAKRLLIRVLSLPARTVDLQTSGFRVPEKPAVKLPPR